MKKIMFIFLTTIFLLTSCQNPVEKIISEVKPFFGTMVDSETRFDNAYIGENRVFYYVYSVDFDGYDTPFQRRLFERIVQETLKAQITPIQHLKF